MAKPYDFGEAVKAIAHLTQRMSVLTDVGNAATNMDAAAIALQARDAAARDLAATTEEFNERLRAALAGARP